MQVKPWVRSGKSLNILFCHNQYQQRSGEDVAFDFAVRLLREDGHRVSVYSRSNLEIERFSLADKLLFPLHTVYSRAERKRIHEFVGAEHRPSLSSKMFSPYCRLLFTTAWRILVCRSYNSCSITGCSVRTACCLPKEKSASAAWVGPSARRPASLLPG